MDDLSGLASTIAAGVGDLRGCLILSGDGLVVGAYLSDGEGTVKPAWIRFAAVGKPERGFVQFGTETWCYVRRGPYAAFVVAGPGARPRLVIDHMDRVLLSAEESRITRSGARDEPAVPSPPTSKPRNPLHPEPRTSEDPVVIGSGAAAPVGALPEPPEPSAEDAGGLDAGLWDLTDDDGDVDRFSPARGFGQLLQDEDGGADG